MDHDNLDGFQHLLPRSTEQCHVQYGLRRRQWQRGPGSLFLVYGLAVCSIGLEFF